MSNGKGRHLDEREGDVGVVALVELEVIWGGCSLPFARSGWIGRRFEKDRTKWVTKLAHRFCDGGGVGSEVVSERSGREARGLHPGRGDRTDTVLPP